MTAESLKYLKENHSAEYQKIYTENREKLIAEALMYNQGKSWQNGRGWTGNFSSLKMTDDSTIGQVIINKTENGYERFGITAEIVRDQNSYNSTRKNPDNPNYKDYQGLDSMFIYKKDLNGNILESIRIDGWQTVSNGYTETYNGSETPKAYPWNWDENSTESIYRNDTVAKDTYFNIRVGNFTSSHYEGPIFVISDFTAMDGSKYGAASSPYYRTLVHSDKNFDGKTYRPSVYGSISAACFINTPKRINYIQNNVINWGTTYPYNIKTIIRDRRY